MMFLDVVRQSIQRIEAAGGSTLHICVCHRIEITHSLPLSNGIAEGIHGIHVFGS